MRILKFVLVSVLSLSTLVCAPVIAKKPQNPKYISEKFDIVSMDASICGIYGTLPIQGEIEIYTKGFITSITFVILDPTGKENLYSKSELLVQDLRVAFKFIDFPLVGTMRQEDRTDGQYLIFNIPTDPETIKYEEMELELYKLNKITYPDYNYKSLTEKQEKKVENLKKGFDWVFKKK